MSTEIFDSCVRPKGDLAGVFEYDGETGYFYLCRAKGNAVEAILDSIHVFSGQPSFGEMDVLMRWDRQEEKVGLFIRGELWAVFDPTNRKSYGRAAAAGGATPAIALEASAGFEGPDHDSPSGLEGAQ
jgi:hypothetical protein